MTRTILLVLFFAGLLAQSQAIPLCDACENECRLLDPSCLFHRLSCRVLGKGTCAYLGGIDFFCKRHSTNSNNVRSRINEANALLIERNIFDIEFLQGIEVNGCSGYSRLVRTFFRANSVGLSPGPDYMWMDESFTENGIFDDFTLFLAHHYYLCGMWRRLGTSKFRCDYTAEVLGGGRNTPDDNWIEAEAYEFMYNITDCVVSNVYCP